DDGPPQDRGERAGRSRRAVRVYRRRGRRTAVAAAGRGARQFDQRDGDQGQLIIHARRAADMRSTLRRASVLGLVALAGIVLVATGAMPTALRGHGSALVPTQSRGHGTQQQPAADAPVPTNVVRQGFPAAAYDPEDVTKSETAWEVEWE